MPRPWDRIIYDVPISVTTPITRGVALAVSPEQLAQFNNPAVSPSTRAFDLLQLVEARHQITSHWSADPVMARHFALVALQRHQAAPAMLAVVLHAAAPSQTDIEHDPETLYRLNIQGQSVEREVPLRPDTTVMITGLAWWDGHHVDDRHDFHTPAGGVEKTVLSALERASSMVESAFVF